MPLQLPQSGLTMYCSSSWVWARSAQSSVNSSSTISTSMVLVCARRRRRLKILPSVLKRMKIPSTKSSFASRNIKLKRMENKVGARKHPCLTPFAIGKLSERAPLCLTWPIWPSCSWRRMVRNFGGQPRRARITVSKALVRSMKATNRSMFCSRHSWIWRSTCPSVGPEATLALSCVLLGNGGNQPVKHEACQDLASYGEESNASVIWAVWFHPFVLIEGYYDGVS